MHYNWKGIVLLEKKFILVVNYIADSRQPLSSEKREIKLICWENINWNDQLISEKENNKWMEVKEWRARTLIEKSYKYGRY